MALSAPKHKQPEGADIDRLLNGIETKTEGWASLPGKLPVTSF
jgi:hypothetical protein